MQLTREGLEHAAGEITKDELDTRMYFAVVAAVLAATLALLV